MQGRIDIHSHLLPGIDDGCSALDESIRCARELVSAGYTHSFCTPHIWPSLPDNDRDRIVSAVERLQQELDRAAIPLRLIPGGELSMRPATAHTTSAELISYAMAGRYVLIDLWADRLPIFFAPSIKALQALGTTVILAHPERMRAVQDHPELADQFAEMGLLLQGNLQCLGDAPHTATRRTIERFLHEDRYFALGSDLHGMDTWPIRLAGLRRAIELVGDEVVDRLTCTNPAKLLPTAGPPHQLD